MKSRVRLFLRGIYRVLTGLNGFLYDFRRFFLYGGWRENLKDTITRNYNVMMAYHGLEKSLSFKNRNPNSGWGNAERVFTRLKIAASEKEIGYHDHGAKEVLLKFLQLQANKERPRAKQMLQELKTMNFKSDDAHGSIELERDFFRKGVLKKPEDFFFSRYSLREYAPQKVEDELIERGIKLAMKTPSVCNRHAWHIYHSSERDIIDTTLKYQNGNRPFGKKVPNLLVITVDLKGFFAGAEHYQHWIDGGLVSMSLMYAFHSLGVASCPLNWCQNPKTDLALRKKIKVKKSHTVIMMMALGYADETNKVCASGRRHVNEIYSKIEVR